MKEEVSIKRSIRIPRGLYKEIEEESRKRGKYMNQVIIERLGREYGVEVRRGKEREKVEIEGEEGEEENTHLIGRRRRRKKGGERKDGRRRI